MKKKLGFVYLVAIFLVWLVFMVTTWLLGPRMPPYSPTFLQLAWYGSAVCLFLNSTYLCIESLVIATKALWRSR